MTSAKEETVKTMKAAIAEAPGRLSVREIPVPRIGPYEALCEGLYGAVCTGTDQHLLAGRFPWPVKYPTVLGHESVGRVVEVGGKVRSFAAGDLVTRVGIPPAPDGAYSANWGGFVQYAVARDHWAMAEDGLPESEWRGHRVNQKLPEGTDPAGATMVITWRETLSYFQRLGIGPGARVLVLGSGGNGLSFAAHARNLGAAFVAMSGHPEREELARQAGAAACCDYRREDLAAALGRSSPEGFDCILDAVGKEGQLDRVLPLLKPGGTVGIYGIDDYGRCAIRPQRARGTFTFYNGGYDEAETHRQVLAFMAAGSLDPRLWLDLEHPFALAEIGQAFAALRARRLVKALIRLNG
jgi:D-arabinose 1-dehydrogenase-like Zn-dependent alcohol dehydrogenase